MIYKFSINATFHKTLRGLVGKNREFGGQTKKINFVYILSGDRSLPKHNYPGSFLISNMSLPWQLANYVFSKFS